MSDPRKIYVPKIGYDGPEIAVYEVVKETPKLFKTRSLTWNGYCSRFEKGDPNIYFSLEEARTKLVLLVSNQVTALESQLVEAKGWLGKIEQLPIRWMAPRRCGDE